MAGSDNIRSILSQWQQRICDADHILSDQYIYDYDDRFWTSMTASFEEAIYIMEMVDSATHGRSFSRRAEPGQTVTTAPWRLCGRRLPLDRGLGEKGGDPIASIREWAAQNSRPPSMMMGAGS